MTGQFTYSILQYRHSLLLNESVNVGIVFSFPDERMIRFVSGNLNRVKCLYPDFNPTFFNIVVKGIKAKVVPESDNLFYNHNLESFKQQLNQLLIADSSALQFTEPIVALNTFKEHNNTVEAFSKLLLPDSQTTKEEVAVHNEQYILKRFTELIKSRNIPIETRMGRDKKLQAKGFTLTFDYVWKNGVTHLVKSISLDLKLGREIQDKAVRYLGYLDLFGEYAKKYGYFFDYLIAKPTNPDLFKAYDSALNVLSDANAPKEIVTEEKLEEYSEKTAEVLQTQGLDDVQETEVV